jgi:hypothetical protein
MDWIPNIVLSGANVVAANGRIKLMFGLMVLSGASTGKYNNIQPELQVRNAPRDLE